MFVLILLINLAAIVVAQEPKASQLPACAQTCLGTATSQQGSCSNVDLKCLCSNIAYINVLACCISTKCTSEDQQKAVAFNSQLCAGVNVTIPNFLGCAPTTTPASGSKTAKLPSSTASGQSKTSEFSASVVQKIGTAVTLPTNPPLAQFTGGPLLEGTCNTPQFASVTLSGGGTLEYPWLGCSYENPGCCPFDIHVGGILSVCPNDYTTTGPACCPSGWSVYSTAFAGQTPCYTNPPTPLIPPAVASAIKGASISVINTKIFSLQLPLKSKKSGLSTGAKAGIGIGVTLGALAALAILFLLLRQKRRATQQNLPHDPIDPALPLPPMTPYTGDKRNSTFSQIHAPLGHISELPSPAPGRYQEMNFPPPESPVPPGPIMMSGAQQEHSIPLPPQSPVEMLGDTYIHEHHPAHASSAISEDPSPLSPPALRGGRDSPGSPGSPGGGVVSPLSERGEGPAGRVQSNWGSPI